MMRVHGQNKRYHHKYIGMEGRLDTLQAAVLQTKIPHHHTEIEGRNRVAQAYNKQIRGTVTTPQVKADRTSVWAQHTVRVQGRDGLQAKLKELGVPTAVHYPIPLHLQECFQYLSLKQGDFPISEKVAQEVMSLPMNPFLTSEEIDYVSQVLISSLQA